VERGGLDDDRVNAEFERIETVAMLERQQVIIAMYHKGLALAWNDVGKAKHKLGRLDEKLGVKE